MVRLGLNETVIFEQSLKEMWNQPCGYLRRRAFQADGIASEKTLRQECAWLCFRNRQKPEWLEQSEREVRRSVLLKL